MAKTLDTKLTQMRAFFGDENAKKILDAAEAKEKQAEKAGVDFKEVKSKAKDEKINLSDLLAQIDAGLESGAIVNDVEESADEGAATEQPDEKALNEQREAFKELIAEVLDEKLPKYFKAADEAQATKEKQPDPKQTELETKIKEAEAAMEKLRTELKELQGDQPKSAGFRASQAEQTVTKESSPKTAPSNGFASFIDEFVMGTPNTAKP